VGKEKLEKRDKRLKHEEGRMSQPNTPAGDAYYDAKLEDQEAEQSTIRRPAMPGSFLQDSVEVDPDEAD
jgi:hypothetical protein